MPSLVLVHGDRGIAVYHQRTRVAADLARSSGELGSRFSVAQRDFVFKSSV